MLTTKFLLSAAATIATAGAIGVAVAQTTVNQDPKSEPQSPPASSTSATVPSTNDSSSSAATTAPSTTGAAGSSVSGDAPMAKTDRN
jgi:hypothetical protein